MSSSDGPPVSSAMEQRGGHPEHDLVERVVFLRALERWRLQGWVDPVSWSSCWVWWSWRAMSTASLGGCGRTVYPSSRPDFQPTVTGTCFLARRVAFGDPLAAPEAAGGGALSRRWLH